jgi:hypothetical protein
VGHLVPVVVIFLWAGTVLLYDYKAVKSLCAFGRKVAISGPSGVSLPEGPAIPAVLLKAPAEPAPSSTTGSEYDHALTSERVTFEESEPGTQTTVGPAALLLGHFWPDSKEPHVWLKVKVAPLPNLELAGRKAAKVSIEKVLNRDNVDIYNPSSNFESQFFQTISLSQQNHPAPHYTAIRDVHLKQGTKEDDIEKVSGTIILTLPEKIDSVSLDASMAGKETSVAGAKVTLGEIKGRNVALKYRGDYQCYLTAVAYDQAGKRLPEDISSWSTADGMTAVNCKFIGEVHSVKLFVANSMLERKYHFELKK